MDGSSARVTNGFYYIAGIGFMALAKAKHMLRGYATPKPFNDVQSCIDYDIRIGQHYMQHADIVDKHVLELGPGSDLGTGLYLLANGAASYTAADRNNLAGGPDAQAFYEQFVRAIGVPEKVVAELQREVRLAAAGDSERLRYVAREDFRFASVIPAKSIDLVVSNAAFEHFDDIRDVIAQISQVVKPGGQIVATIDLQTHSRWIREKDPNNIYRYSDSTYRMFYFPGQPNRVRPYEYRQHLATHGWRDIQTTPATTFDSSGYTVHPRFENTTNELDCLSFVLRATYTSPNA